MIRTRAPRAVRRRGRVISAEAYGLRQKATHLRDEAPPDSDPALANKVRSQAFRGTDIPAGRVNVSSEDGVIVLIGELERPDQITSLEERVGSIDGVRGVRNLLHVAGTPAPSG